MTVRQFLEKEEYRYLSPYAAKSSLSRGRERPITPDDTRTEYQRDRDRVLHSKAL